MDKLITIGEAAKYLGISTQTIRRWEKTGKGFPSQRTQGNQRRYRVADLGFPLRSSQPKEKLTLAYARVSCHDQKEDLKRQEEMLEFFCSSNGWEFEILSDLGSGMNYQKKGLKRLINKILNQEIFRLVITHKDRCYGLVLSLFFQYASKEVLK